VEWDSPKQPLSYTARKEKKWHVVTLSTPLVFVDGDVGAMGGKRYCCQTSGGISGSTKG